MLLYPAIDLMGGQVVRLKQGRASEKTVYSDDPAAVAREWEARGGDWLHIVDLDAAFGGKHANLDKVRAIAATVSIPVQMGGGMRDEQAIRDVEIGPGVRSVSQQNPISNTARVLVLEPMESESIVQVAKNSAGDQPESEGQPVRSACVEDEEPKHDADGSDN